MKEYVEIPGGILESAEAFADWLALAHRFAAALPPKEKKTAGRR